MEKRILITGVNGFVGRKLTDVLKSDYLLSGVDIADSGGVDFLYFRGDFTLKTFTKKIIKETNPDVIIHCAGIAHQKVGAVNDEDYKRINGKGTINLAKIAMENNPDIHFIFLSTVSVYGEENTEPKDENYPFNPTSSYAESKIYAEKNLSSLGLKKLTVLRLAPVYDSSFTLNLDRRVFFPKKLTYLKFGSGTQKMSALSRDNLAGFVKYAINNKLCGVYNVADSTPYSFNEIIKIFKKTEFQPNRIVVKVPLVLVWILTRIFSNIIRSRKKWIDACYDKLAMDLVYDNTMLKNTGYKLENNIEKVFLKDKR